jgi:hypothetical protein
MAMTHTTAGNSGESATREASEAAVRASEDVPPSSAPFGALAGGARNIEAGGGQAPG